MKTYNYTGTDDEDAMPQPSLSSTTRHETSETPEESEVHKVEKREEKERRRRRKERRKWRLAFRRRCVGGNSTSFQSNSPTSRALGRGIDIHRKSRSEESSSATTSSRQLSRHGAFSISGISGSSTLPSYAASWKIPNP
jgi:hypothetical protein